MVESVAQVIHTQMVAFLGDVRRALTAIDPLWDQLFPAEQNRIVRLLVDRVEIREDGMEVAVRGEGLGSVVGEITGIFEQANERNAR